MTSTTTSSNTMKPNTITKVLPKLLLISFGVNYPTIHDTTQDINNILISNAAAIIDGKNGFLGLTVTYNQDFP